MAIQNGLWPISRIGNNGSFWKCNNNMKYGMPKYIWGSTWKGKKTSKSNAKSALTDLQVIKSQHIVCSFCCCFYVATNILDHLSEKWPV